MHPAIAHVLRAARHGDRVILCTRNPTLIRDCLEHARSEPDVTRITYSTGMQCITLEHGGRILIRTAQGMRGSTADLVILDELSGLEQARHVTAPSRRGHVIDLNGRTLAIGATIR